ARAVWRAAGVDLPEAPWVAVVGIEDGADAMSWQVRQLLQEFPPAGFRGLEVRAGVAGQPLWEALAEATDLPDARLSFKANLLPGATASFCLRAAGASDGV